MRPAVFLDRDGTMVQEVGYLGRPEDLRWFSWTIDAIRLLRRAGFLIFVTTNQGGIGLGLFSEKFLQQLHETMDRHLAEAGANVDAWFYCPHHPRAIVPDLALACECRKPEPGMIRQAQQRFAIDLGRSFVVGDKRIDVELAERARVRGILVRTGNGAQELERSGGVMPGAAHVAETLLDAASWILLVSGHPKEPNT
jgi:D-glycero-D-manno-heptose 1,7-bisphosphate phosphatase